LKRLAKEHNLNGVEEYAIRLRREHVLSCKKKFCFFEGGKRKKQQPKVVAILIMGVLVVTQQHAAVRHLQRRRLLWQASRIIPMTQTATRHIGGPSVVLPNQQHIAIVSQVENAIYIMDTKTFRVRIFPHSINTN
jgi:hypothetical protein